MATDRLNDKAKRFTNQAYQEGNHESICGRHQVGETVLADDKPEISIGNIDIYEINKKFSLFRGYEPTASYNNRVVFDQHGDMTSSYNMDSLQDAVNMALAIEFDNSQYPTIHTE